MNLDDPKDRVDDDDSPETLDEDPGEDDGDADDGDEGDGEDDVPAGDEAEPESGEAPDEVEPEPRRRVTANDRIRNLSKAEKAAKAEAEQRAREAAEERRLREAAERRAEEAERRANERRAAETAEQEAARVELMSADEKLEHYRRKDREESDRRFQQLQFQQWDSADRSDFRQLARDNPLVAKVKDKVEARFQELVKTGRPVSREILADLELGRTTRESYRDTAKTQRERARSRVERETVRPPRTRSDVAPERTRRGEVNEREARRKRLENVEL